MSPHDDALAHTSTPIPMTGPAEQAGVLPLSETSWMVVDPAGTSVHGYVALETAGTEAHDGTRRASDDYTAYDADEVRLSSHPSHEAAVAAVVASTSVVAATD